MRFFTTFIISLLAFLILAFYKVSFPVVLTTGVLIFLFMMYPILRMTLFETNIEKIEKFILKNKKDPNFYIIYALANELDDEVDHLTDKLVKKSALSSRRATYQVIRDIYFKDFSAAKLQLKEIKSLQFKYYYEALIALEEENYSEANQLIEKITTAWMKDALLAEREKKQNNLTKAKEYAGKAKQKTKGLQHYLLHKTYEREFQL
jgi:hypothetical protein